jgi:hypothetical protein
MTAADIAILDTVPQINVQISVEGFYKQCYDIFVSANEQFNRVAQYHSSKKRAHAQAAVLKWYCDTDCVFVSTPTLFSDWFSENGITLSETDDLGDWQSLYETIFTAGSGLDKNNVIDMRQVQKAMLAILKQLSSYTIQFIDEYTGVDIVPLCFVHPRHEATRIEEYAGAYYDGFDFEIKHRASMDYASALYRIQFNDAHHRAHDYDSVKVDFGPKFYGDPLPGTEDGVVDMGVNFESDTSIIGPDMSDCSTMWVLTPVVTKVSLLIGVSKGSGRSSLLLRPQGRQKTASTFLHCLQTFSLQRPMSARCISNFSCLQRRDVQKNHFTQSKNGPNIDYLLSLRFQPAVARAEYVRVSSMPCQIIR